jgi:hypothetical protein
MSNEVLNTLILTVFLAAAVGAGYYVTKKKQPQELAAIQEKISAIENASAEVETLMQQEAIASEEAAVTLQRWNTRYKVLPPTLSSPDVVQFLNALSTRGFERFDLTLSGVTQGTDASFFTYQITGEAYFESLFAFIWHLENGRGLYRVRDLSIKKEVKTITRPGETTGRQVVLAQFSMAVDAYYSGNPDISAPDSAVAPPPEAFPARRAANNPFFPYIMESIPPNSDDLVDIATDNLVGVIGGTAVFQRGNQMRELRSGDRVYLGRISSIDPQRARVVVDLNKGGIRERAELDLETGEVYRQHLGRSLTVPNYRRMGSVPAGPALQEAPPAPGTPEAIRSGLYDSMPAEPVSGGAQPPRRPGAPYQPAPLQGQ